MQEPFELQNPIYYIVKDWDIMDLWGYHVAYTSRKEKTTGCLEPGPDGRSLLSNTVSASQDAPEEKVHFVKFGHSSHLHMQNILAYKTIIVRTIHRETSIEIRVPYNA